MISLDKVCSVKANVVFFFRLYNPVYCTLVKEMRLLKQQRLPFQPSSRNISISSETDSEKEKRKGFFLRRGQFVILSALFLGAWEAGTAVMFHRLALCFEYLIGREIVILWGNSFFFLYMHDCTPHDAVQFNETKIKLTFPSTQPIYLKWLVKIFPKHGKAFFLLRFLLSRTCAFTQRKKMT